MAMRISRKQIGYLGITLLAIILAVYFSVRFLIDPTFAAALYMPELQRVLDETCGEGVIKADPSHFTRDPVTSWWGEAATCIQDNGWKCNCRPYDLP
jgi:hypothetical protein